MTHRYIVLPLLLLGALSIAACGGGGGGGTGDITEPVAFNVKTMDPRNGSGNLPNDSSVTIIFTQRLDPNTLTELSFSVTERGEAAPHPGTFEVSVNGLSATYSPDPWFDIATTYDVEVTEELLSISGEALNATYRATLTTGPWASPEPVEQYQFTELRNRMVQGRSRHSSTLLPSSHVLIVGGYVTGAAITNTAELYDPGRADFLRTSGDLSMPRANHTAAFAPTRGFVLIAGGERPSDLKATSTAELYLVATSRFTATAPMFFERTSHTATTLQDGRILVTGGKTQDSSGARVTHASAEIYDPSTETWSMVNSMSVPRWAHRATLLSDGRVLITGGSDTTSVDIFDPSTDKMRKLTRGMIYLRSQHNAVQLESGVVLLSDGGPREGEYFDPVTESFFLTANKASTIRYAAVSFEFRPGEALVMGGYEFTANFTSIFVHSSMEQFLLNYGSGGSFFHVPALPDRGVYLKDARAFAAATNMGGNSGPRGPFLITGGLGASFDGPDLNTAVVFDPDAEE